MRLLRDITAGVVCLLLTSCSESPREAPESMLSQSDAEHTAGQDHHREPGGEPATHDVTGRSGPENRPLSVGDRVPDFEVTLDGRTWKLSELRENRDLTLDGTLVLMFWCSFCHSCRDMEQELNRLARQYRGKAGVIALDASAGETRESVAAFAKENELTMPIALNANGSVADIFGVNATTTTAVIDSTGTLRYLGQFQDHRHTYALDALKAVLAGTEVTISRTRPSG